MHGTIIFYRIFYKPGYFKTISPGRQLCQIFKVIYLVMYHKLVVDLSDIFYFLQITIYTPL